MKLLHGTTRSRAERIVAFGPDPRFCEPGGQPSEEGFSTCLESGPFPFGTPSDYARGKAARFPNEGGPAIVEVDVPDEIVARAADAFFPLRQGLVQFDLGSGIDELIAAWPSLAKRITALQDA
jgi:hypothetical protein